MSQFIPLVIESEIPNKPWNHPYIDYIVEDNFELNDEGKYVTKDRQHLIQFTLNAGTTTVSAISGVVLLNEDEYNQPINDLLEAECEELIHFLYAELINFLYRDKYIYDSEFVNSHIDFDNDNLSVDIYTSASLYKNGLNDLNETNWNF